MKAGAGKYKLGARAVKYKFGAEAIKYKLGPESRARAGGRETQIPVKSYIEGILHIHLNSHFWTYTVNVNIEIFLRIVTSVYQRLGIVWKIMSNVKF